MWVMRNLRFLGKISIFKTLSFSEIIYLILVPLQLIFLIKYKKDLLRDKKNAKINIQPYVAITPMVV